MPNINKFSHAEFGKLIIRLQPEKEAIERRFAKGEAIVSVASRYKTPQSTFRSACEAIGITLPVRGDNAPPKVKANIVLDDLLIVVARLAEGLNVDYSEIKPHLGK